MAASVVVLVLLGLAGVVTTLVFVVRADRAARSAAWQVREESRRQGAAMGELRDAVDALHREVGRLLARTDRDRYPSASSR
jgi:hypothetical protein